MEIETLDPLDPLDPLDQLAHESDVTGKLIERLAETALTLAGGQDTGPGELREGLGLLQQYLAVHAARVDRDLRPEAEAVAMPGCFDHLDDLAKDHRSAQERIDEVLGVVREYARDREASRARLAKALTDLTERIHEDLAYEGDYPLSCLRAALPEEAASRVSATYRRTDADVSDLERHIARHLGSGPRGAEHPLLVRCRHVGCEAEGSAAVRPSTEGRLGIEVPEGWSVESQPAAMGADGTVRLRVDFFCANHRDGARSGEERERRMNRHGASDASPSPAGEPAGGCCDPLPVETR